MFDLDKRVYRLRELTREPLAPGALRFASEQEEKADMAIKAKPTDKGTKSGKKAGKKSSTIGSGGAGKKAKEAVLGNK